MKKGKKNEKTCKKSIIIYIHRSLLMPVFRSIILYFLSVVLSKFCNNISIIHRSKYIEKTRNTNM